MAKDFCFLFYFQNYDFGTRFFDRRHKGAYVDLLVAQADLFVNGKDYKMSLSYVKQVLTSDFDTWEILNEKYEEENGKYWNASLEEKQIARKTFTDSRKNNRLGKKKVNNTSSSSDKLVVNKDINKDKDKNPYKEVIDDLNQKLGKRYKVTDTHKKHMRARFDEGYSLDDFKRVNDIKIKEWRGTDYEKHLKPITLYGPKFDGYLNQPEANNTVSSVTPGNFDSAEPVFAKLLEEQRIEEEREQNEEQNN